MLKCQLKNIGYSFFAAVVFLIFTFNKCSDEINEENISYTGTFYANDCGISHGGFEWVGEYNAELYITGNDGTLNLEFAGGLGDLLERHNFSITDFTETADNIQFYIDEILVTLVFTKLDSVWNGLYNNYYIANFSLDSAESIGTVPIEIFHGFSEFFYVELRLKE